MNFSSARFLPLLLLTACTSVKVNRVAEGKLPKTPLREVQLVSAEAAKQRPKETLATIDMRTRSPFAADLNAIARERTAKLGGNAYVITSGNRQTTMSGGFGSLFGDSTSAEMSIEALRWKDLPAPATAAAAKPGAASGSKPAPGVAPQPAKPQKTKAWWRPWSWF